MFSLWSLFHLVILVKFSISDQLCIDKCDFEYNLYSNFSLPATCNVIRRNRCYVLTVFDYTKEMIKVHFSLEPDDNDIVNGDNQTDTVVHSNINLAEPAFIQHSIAYFCATGDQCDLEFVRDIVLPTFVNKSCDKFRSKLIEYLNPDSPSTDRDCYQNDSTILKCYASCELIYTNPDDIYRSCDGDLELKFEAIVGQSKPIDKSEYQYRTWSFACNTPLCNGKSMQERVESLIAYDHGECLISFREINETTTSLPSRSASIYSQLFALFFFIIYFVL